MDTSKARASTWALASRRTVSATTPATTITITVPPRCTPKDAPTALLLFRNDASTGNVTGIGIKLRCALRPPTPRSMRERCELEWIADPRRPVPLPLAPLRRGLFLLARRSCRARHPQSPASPRYECSFDRLASSATFAPGSG